MRACVLCAVICAQQQTIDTHCVRLNGLAGMLRTAKPVNAARTQSECVYARDDGKDAIFDYFFSFFLLLLCALLRSTRFMNNSGAQNASACVPYCFRI